MPFSRQFYSLWTARALWLRSERGLVILTFRANNTVNHQYQNMETTTNESTLDIPEYPYLETHGIYNPAILVQHAIARGEIRLPLPPSTKPRCPVGKKAAFDQEQREREAHKRAAASHRYTPSSHLYHAAAFASLQPVSAD